MKYLGAIYCNLYTPKILMKKLAKSSTVKRIPRPLGLTELMGQYHKGNQNMDVIRTYLIQQWIISHGVICGKTYNTLELSNFLKCDPDQIRLQMRNVMLNTKLFTLENQQEVIESLIGQQITWALEDRMEIEHQVSILKDSQGMKYTPFITAELNKVLGLKLNSSSNLQSILRSLNSGSTNIFNQQNNISVESPGVDIAEAVEIIQQENEKLDSNKDVQYLDAHYNVRELPVVVANEQDGVDTSKEGLNLKRRDIENIVDNYKGTLQEFKAEEAEYEDLQDHHDSRREKELGIDPDYPDPETLIYPG